MNLIIVFGVFLVAQGSLANCGCNEKSPELFWKDGLMESCLQWPLLKQFIAGIPDTTIKVEIGKLYRTYWAFANYGPEQAVDQFLKSYSKRLDRYKHWKGAAVAIDYAKKSAKQIKPSLSENVESLVPVFAQWLKKTLLAPAIAPDSREGWPDFRNYHCTPFKQKEKEEEFMDIQRMMVEDYKRSFLGLKDNFLREALWLLKGLSRCEIDVSNKTTRPDGEGKLFRCLGDKLRYLNDNLFRPLWRWIVNPRVGDYYKYTLANASVSLDRLVSDGLACLVDLDSKDNLAERLYSGFGDNQPFTQIFAWLGQFHYQLNTTALEIEEERGDFNYDYYYLDYTRRVERPVLDVLITKYQREIKDGILFLNRTLNRERIDASITTLVEKTATVLKEIPWMSEYYAIFEDYPPHPMDFQKRTEHCSYLTRFWTGNFPELEIYIDKELNKIIYSWSDDEKLAFTKRVKDGIDMVKKEIGKVLFSGDLPKQRFLEKMKTFLQNPYPTLDSMIEQYKFEETLGLLVQTLLPRDPTGKTELLEEMEIFGMSYMLDYQQAFRMLVLSHIRKYDWF